MTRILGACCVIVLCLCRAVAYADETAERLQKLEATVEEQSKTIEKQQESIEALKKNAEQKQNQVGTQESKEPLPSKTGGLFGGSAFANPNISLILDTFGYSSNLNDTELANWGIPGFTTQGLDQRNGFNLDSAELFIFSPVDPYFDLYANLPATESGISIEEAYVVTTALPEGWQVKGGKFKSNFSRLDAQHPHAWDFFDIPLPYRAFLGNEGLGGEKGIQLTYLPILPIYTQIGAEVLQGDNDLLFGSDAAEGPHAYSFFVKSSVDTSDYSTLYFGPYVLFGKTENANIIQGEEVTANSALYGMEAVWKWKPAVREALTIQSEYLYLTQSGNAMEQTSLVLSGLERRQDGFYIQGIYRKNRWGIGARYDMLELFSNSFKFAGVQQNFGGKPWRETASLEFNPTEFTRIRLQLTHDKSDTMTGRTNDEAILQFNFSVGAHPAHTF